jgi:hypothetical protein
MLLERCNDFHSHSSIFQFPWSADLHRQPNPRSQVAELQIAHRGKDDDAWKLLISCLIVHSLKWNALHLLSRLLPILFADPFLARVEYSIDWY